MLSAGAAAHLHCHAVGVGAEGGGRGTRVGDGVGAGFADVNPGGRDAELTTGNLGNKTVFFFFFKDATNQRSSMEAVLSTCCILVWMPWPISVPA